MSTERSCQHGADDLFMWYHSIHFHFHFAAILILSSLRPFFRSMLAPMIYVDAPSLIFSISIKFPCQSFWLHSSSMLLPSEHFPYFASFSMTYGISTSSSVSSSAVISKMTFFWWAGIGFLLMVSTRVDIL